MAEPSPTSAASHRTCPECGTAVQERQRRCTNCGASVDALRRRIPRRTPLVAALAVAGIGTGAAVVAQAAVTDEASLNASAPADTASAPVQIQYPPLPDAKRPTSTPPKPDAPAPSTDTELTIPSVDDQVGTVVTPDTNDGPDGTPVPSDTAADPDDLNEVKTIKVKRATNYDPEQRVGVEFGNPKAAIDKRSRTVWDVNVPADGQPMNVGIVLDLGETKRVRELRIGTPTPRFGAVFGRAETEEIPPTVDDDNWTSAGKVDEVSDDLVVPLTRSGDAKWARYIVVFLTTPPGPNDTRVAISNLEVLP